MVDEELSEGEFNVYGGNARENMMTDDAISPEEEAFMAGYDEDDSDESDSDEDAYEEAFASKRAKKKKFDEEELFNDHESLEDNEDLE